MHCSSLGEFEQGLTVIEQIKTVPGILYRGYFFSPSGYEHEKNNQVADHVFYLPIDSKSNASAFLNLYNPASYYL